MASSTAHACAGDSPAMPCQMPKVEPQVEVPGLLDDKLGDFPTLIGRQIDMAVVGEVPHEDGYLVVARLMLQHHNPTAESPSQRVASQWDVGDGDD